LLSDNDVESEFLTDALQLLSKRMRVEKVLLRLLNSKEHSLVASKAMKRLASLMGKLSHSFSTRLVNFLIPNLLEGIDENNVTDRMVIISQMVQSVPDIISKFKINFFTEHVNTGKELGAGKFGTVFLGYHMGTAQKVAIKTIDWQKLTCGGRTPERAKNLLLNEINIMKQADHTNVVKLYEIGQDGNDIFLVMEYLGGGDLAALLKEKGPLTETETRRWLRDLALGLKFLREKNVTHRDLKPANLLLTSTGDDGFLKIADFGLSRFLGEESLSNTRLVGTPYYMAPEIVNPPHGNKTDLWSVGVIAYEMLVNTPPYGDARTLQELVMKLHSKVIPFPAEIEISTEMKDFIRSLMTVDPDDRMSWEEFFKHPCVNPAFPSSPSNFHGQMAEQDISTQDEIRKLEQLSEQKENQIQALTHLLEQEKENTEESVRELEKVKNEKELEIKEKEKEIKELLLSHQQEKTNLELDHASAIEQLKLLIDQYQTVIAQVNHTLKTSEKKVLSLEEASGLLKKELSDTQKLYLDEQDKVRGLLDELEKHKTLLLEKQCRSGMEEDKGWPAENLKIPLHAKSYYKDSTSCYYEVESVEIGVSLKVNFAMHGSYGGSVPSQAELVAVNELGEVVNLSENELPYLFDKHWKDGDPNGWLKFVVPPLRKGWGYFLVFHPDFNKVLLFEI